MNDNIFEIKLDNQEAKVIEDAVSIIIVFKNHPWSFVLDKLTREWSAVNRKKVRLMV